MLSPDGRPSAAPAAQASDGGDGSRRRKGQPLRSRSRSRKKQKRLDAIRDNPSFPSTSSPPVDEDSILRRSSRVRRAPAVLDSSPVPSHRRKKIKRGESPVSIVSRGINMRKKKEKNNKLKEKNEEEEKKENKPPTSDKTEGASVVKEIEESAAGIEGWKSRLRTRVMGKAELRKKAQCFKKEEKVRVVLKDVPGSKRRGRRLVLCDDALEATEKVADQAAVSPSNDQETDDDKVLQEERHIDACDLAVECSSNAEFGNTDFICEVRDETSCGKSNAKDEVVEPVHEGIGIQDAHVENAGSGEHLEVQSGEHMEGIAAEVDILKEGGLKSPASGEDLDQTSLKEGRRCGLCGGGTDGRPPKILVQESVESENEAYEGSLASEEPNYDVWDGFGDDPGWLGRLLGPIHDRFGIARVWVHQNCAVWSPEVYFAGLGCLKNVRAALCRGRALKCSRCGRPGATIGCRVDRCPKTYHLPCSRADACIFDHRKFLIACNDHRHLFQPQGDKYSQLIKKMKAKKVKMDMRRLSHDACRKDLEAEEKWLENCGEDEEFLKREGKRLHRDLLRIAPVYIGGSTANENLHQGWESVAGLQDVIQSMKEVVILPLLYPEFFSALGLTPPRGILLHGYPGTGKTLVVRALIGECSRGNKRIAYFARKGADCLGKYVGDAERQLRLLFQVAERSQPSIIFFDEIDGLAPCRSKQQDQTHNSVVSTLLSLLDGLKPRGSVIVIGATNRPDAVDPALRRPGRFDREIYFPLPSYEDRSAILMLHTKSWPNPASGSLLSFVTGQTVGYAGADLQALCTQAAMNALKRNCPLQELLSSAEKGGGCVRLPSLPSFIVEERDWLAALASSPPPCSRREAGMAANDVVSSPLDSHLVPCLLKPLSYLLISLYIDERIWLPPPLVKASASVKDIIFSALEQNVVPVAFWSAHLQSLMQQHDIANKIESVLLHYGLVTGQSGPHSDRSDTHNGNHEKFNLPRSKYSEFHAQGRTCLRSSGVRTLIAGTSRFGQQHLACCLLHGFMGQIEIHKVNLATMLQKGNGDIVLGLTQILLKCLNMGRCVIYMPRIDMWAIDKSHELGTSHNMINPEKKKLPQSALSNKVRISSSEVWNSFVEQVDSACMPVSAVILATCELQFHDLPIGVRKFFNNDVLDQLGSGPLEHTVPRLSVELGGSFDHGLMIHSCALRMSHDLVQHYIQLVHHRIHERNHLELNEVICMKSNALIKKTDMENKPSAVKEIPLDHEMSAFNEDSFKDNQTQICMNSNTRSSSSTKNGVQNHHHQKPALKNLHNKVVKGSSFLAIATFGYQILRCPQFAELCWVTSKLKEGPCVHINGPWKGWLFNCCMLQTSNSPEKVGGGVNNIVKDREECGTVRGLVAIGLLAYRGVYTSVMEVSFDVRKVLEHLVGQIRSKIMDKKDRYRYLHILSQVAYLEDIVNSWAFTHSEQADNRTIPTCGKPALPGKLCINNVDEEPSNVQTAPGVCINGVQDVSNQCSPEKFKISNNESDLPSHVLLASARRIIPEHEPFKPSVCISSQSSLLGANTVINLNGNSGSEIPVSNRVESVETLNGLQRIEAPISSTADICDLGSTIAQLSPLSNEVNVQANGVDTNLSMNEIELACSKLGMASEVMLDKTKGTSVVSRTSCLYKCCPECLHGVYLLVHDILSSSLKSNSYCSTIGDIHDILTACSLNLLAAVRKCCSSQGNVLFNETFGGKQFQNNLTEQCVCHGITSRHLKKTLCRQNMAKMKELLPKECICHVRNTEDSEIANSDVGSSLKPVLSFFFKDGALMPSTFQKDTTVHSNFKRLCVCSILEVVFMIKRTSS